MAQHLNLSKLFIVFFLSLAVISSIFFSLQTKENISDKYSVTLTRDGFSPREIIVPLGTTVTFSSNIGKPFWPASDPHPSHTNYRAFDSKIIVLADKSWSFTFDKAGKWRYHDHLHPFFTGTIVVRQEDGSLKDCNTAENRKQPECWDDIVISAFDKKGVIGAMSAIGQLYESEPGFIKNGCHRTSHNVGDMAYYRYYRNLDIRNWTFPPEAVYCGYGFFHGLFEHFFREHPDVSEARELCQRLTKTAINQIPAIRQNCFHGAGHGFIPEPPPRDTFGKPDQIMQKALTYCYNISPTNDKLENQECMEGSFNVIADWMNEGQYGLKFDRINPLGFCREQKTKEALLACYYEFSMRVAGIAQDDLVKVAKIYILPSDEDEVADMVMNSSSAGAMERHLLDKDYDKYVLECHQVPERVRLSCIKGLVGGLMATGDPSKEYIKAADFCLSKGLHEDERDVCYQNLASKFKRIYNKNKVTEVCKLIPSKYQKYCVD